MEHLNRVGMVLQFLSFWFAAPEILGEERLKRPERAIERLLAWLTTPPQLPRIDLIATLATLLPFLPVAVLVFLRVGDPAFLDTDARVIVPGFVLHVAVQYSLMLSHMFLSRMQHHQPRPRPLARLSRPAFLLLWFPFVLSAVTYYFEPLLAGSSDPPHAYLLLFLAPLAGTLLFLTIAHAGRHLRHGPQTLGLLLAFTSAVIWVVSTPAESSAPLFVLVSPVILAVPAVLLLTWAPPILSRLRDDSRIRLRLLGIAAAMLTVGMALQFIATW